MIRHRNEIVGTVGMARVRRWMCATDRKAATTVEFGLVGFCFLSLMLFTAELGFYLYAQLSLDYATAYAARQMLTGNARTNGLTAANFQSGTLCPVLAPLLSCANIVVNLFPVDQLAVPNYAAVPSPSSLLTNGRPNAAALQFSVGQNASLMMMQVIYLTPNFLWPFSTTTGQPILIVSTAAYVNET